MNRRVRRPRCGVRCRSLIAVAALALAGTSLAQPIPRSATADDLFTIWGDQPGVRGQVSVIYQQLHTEGLILDSGVNNRGAITDTRSIALTLDYRLTQRWQAHVSVPYVRKRSRRDPGNHNPALLDRPHPESRFLDDGQFHGELQDWILGVSYDTQLGRFHVEPHVELVWPSHDYTFFANAAVGQRLRRLRLGADAFYRLEHSNLYFSAGYSYELVERIMGISLNKHHLRLSAGYYLSPQLSMRAFAQSRHGQGRDSSYLAFADRRSEAWYQHDRLSRHDYAIAGLGATWRFNDTWAVTLNAATMVYGRTVHELEYAYDLQLAKAF